MNPTASPNPLVGTILGDTYQIVRFVAMGGMGELYEASHLRLSGRYAIKVLLPQVAQYEEVIARFQREAEITSSLRHPNIVSVLDFNTTPDGRAFLAMEFLDGRDLSVDLKVGGAMPLPRVMEVVDQVVGALAAAHAHGVVHRDLKPQNLFIAPLPGSDREIVKVLDFGISKVKEARTKLTREHSIIGTPQYMAPEQALGNAPAIDHRTDQFSLAVIVWEMLAAREAFVADDVTAVLYQVVHEQPPALSIYRPELPPDVEPVLLRAMSKDPLQRFASIEEFGKALHAAVRGEVRADRAIATAPTLRRTAAVAEPMQAPLRKNTTFGASTAELNDEELLARVRPPQRRWLFAAVGAVALGAIAVAVWNQTRQPDGAPVAAAVAKPASPETPAVVASPAPLTAEPIAQAAEKPPAADPSVAHPGAAVAGTPAAAVPAAPTVSTDEIPASPPLPSAAAPAPAPAAAMEIATVYVGNAPPDLSVRVNGVPVPLPLRLPRKPGRYRLEFESPGRRSQVVEVDALAQRHEVNLAMPLVAAPARRSLRQREVEIAPEETGPEEVLEPAAEPAAPAKRPRLIEDIEETPAPAAPADKPKVPLIDDI